MGPLYIVTERFDPSHGEAWTNYIAWSQLGQLTDLVTLDSHLCPAVVGEIREEDWSHIVNEDFMLHYFTDLDYLLARSGGAVGRNLLCVFRDPETHPTPPHEGPEFQYLGCDLVDVDGGPSALTNCGGFPLAFANSELSTHGLIRSLSRAKEVQEALRHHYPDEGHAACHVWSVFRAPTE